jgi:hypothetical protein
MASMAIGRLRIFEFSARRLLQLGGFRPPLPSPLYFTAEVRASDPDKEKNLSSATDVSAGNGRYHTQETRGAGVLGCDFDNYLA